MATQRNSTRRMAGRRVLGIGVALALMAALLVPVGASAYTAPGGFTGASSNDSQQVVLHRDGSQAVPFNPVPTAAATTSTSSGGFDWGDAMIGAGGALALIALIGAGGLTIRGRRHVPAQS